MGKFLHIGRRLEEERSKTGLSQTEFGKIGGVTRKSQYNYESGERPPDAAYLEAIAQINGVDIGYIVTGIRSNATCEQPGTYAYLRTDVQQLLNEIEHCSEDDSRAILRVALLAAKECATETERASERASERTKNYPNEAQL